MIVAWAPATSTLPVRARPVLGATRTASFPSPVPVSGVMPSHEAIEDAVHGQKLSVETVSSTVPPSAPIALEGGVTPILQLDAC